MCQGHQDLSLPIDDVAALSLSDVQQSPAHPQKKQKSKDKQQKQQVVKRQTPPATPPPPTHEIVKSESTKLANGKQYIDVLLP